MTRRFKRELQARILSVVAIAAPASLGIISGIFLHTYLGWEGRAFGVGAIGGLFTIGFAVIVATSWDQYTNVEKYPTLYKGKTSWLREWIEEPEEKPKSKTKPREGAWKEDE